MRRFGALVLLGVAQATGTGNALEGHPTCTNVLEVNFDGHEGLPKNYPVEQAARDFGSLVSTRGFSKGRGKLVREGQDEFLRSINPAGCQYASNCGIRVVSEIPDSSNEAWVSYRMRMSSNMDLATSGMLPGVCSGPTCESTCSNPGDMSARVKWYADGTFGPYVNQADGAQCGTNFAFHPEADTEKPPLALQVNRWYTILQHVKLGTTGNRDGVLEFFVDGEPVYEHTAFDWQNNVTDTRAAIEKFALQGYFLVDNPGSVDTWIDFDDISMYTCHPTLSPTTSPTAAPTTAPLCPAAESQLAGDLLDCFTNHSPFPEQDPTCYERVCQGDQPVAELSRCPLASSLVIGDVPCSNTLTSESCALPVSNSVAEFCSNATDFVLNHHLEFVERRESSPDNDMDPGSSDDMLLMTIIIVGSVVALIIVAAVAIAIHRTRKKQTNQKLRREAGEIVVKMDYETQNPMYRDVDSMKASRNPVNHPGMSGTSNNSIDSGPLPLYRKRSGIASTASSASGTSVGSRSGRVLIKPPPGNMAKRPSDVPDDDDFSPSFSRKPTTHHRRDRSFSEVPFLSADIPPPLPPYPNDGDRDSHY